MANHYFKFKQFMIMQEQCAMKVTTDACLFGAWAASKLASEETILDIGAGTGLLSLMLAQKINAKIHCVEIERSCYDQLMLNIKSSSWATRVSGYLSDIKVFDASTKYDLIISNPPFYSNQLKSPDLNTNLARHSDQLLLTDIFNQAERLLKENGTLLLLMPYYRKNETIRTAEMYNYCQVQTADIKQTPEHDAFRTMVSFSKKKNILSDETITIKDETDAYTERFRELLEEYYLNL